MKVYSCSMPNIGDWSAYFSAAATHAERVFVGCGVKSVSSTSHRTRMSPGSRSGSGQVKTGRSTQSEFDPGAWLVLEPSKPQISGSLPSATIRVLFRMIGSGLVPSIQMYSAWYGIHELLIIFGSSTALGHRRRRKWRIRGRSWSDRREAASQFHPDLYRRNLLLCCRSVKNALTGRSDVNSTNHPTRNIGSNHPNQPKPSTIPNPGSRLA